MRNETEVRYSIVVPFYNEEKNLMPLYGKIVDVMDAIGEPFEMVFVDDGSMDRTGELLARIVNNDERVIAIRLRRNFGQTAALKAGFDHASGDVIISMDGDLQHDPAEIPKFIAKLDEGFDIVSGWRVDRVDAWLSRRLPSKIANWSMAKLSGVPLHDFGTTFKAYRYEIIASLQLYGDLHRFIPALATQTGATIVEIPIKNIARENGKSNYNISRTVRVMFDLISVKFLLSYSTRPLHFFGLLGFLSFGLGSAVSVFLLFEKIMFGTSLMGSHGPLLLLAFVLVLSGVQFISIGLLGEILSRTYYESQNKPIYAVREIKQSIHRVQLEATNGLPVRKRYAARPRKSDENFEHYA